MKKILAYFVLFLVSFSAVVQCCAQLNGNFKTVRLLNAGGTDTTTVSNGTFWYNPTVNKFSFRQDGATVHFISGSSGLVFGLTPNTIPYASAANALASTTATYSAPKFTFAPDATNAGINTGSIADNPSSPVNGDLWYNSSDGFMYNRAGGTNNQMLSNAAQTFTGKKTVTPDATNPGLNIGTISGDPSSPATGDIWYETGGGLPKLRRSGATNVIATLSANPISNAIPYSASGTILKQEGAFTYDESTNLMNIGTAGAGGQIQLTDTGVNTTLFLTSGITAQGTAFEVKSNTGNITITPTGDIILNITRTSCSGAPSKSLAIVTGVLTICP